MYPPSDRLVELLHQIYNLPPEEQAEEIEAHFIPTRRPVPGAPSGAPGSSPIGSVWSRRTSSELAVVIGGTMQDLEYRWLDQADLTLVASPASLGRQMRRSGTRYESSSGKAFRRTFRFEGRLYDLGGILSRSLIPARRQVSFEGRLRA